MRRALLVPLAPLLAGCASGDHERIPGDPSREPPAPAGMHLRLVDEGRTHGGTVLRVLEPPDANATLPLGCVAYRDGRATGECRVEPVPDVGWRLHAKWTSPRGTNGVFAFDADGAPLAWWVDACREWRMGLMTPEDARGRALEACP